jgi:hypothetical protein
VISEAGAPIDSAPTSELAIGTPVRAAFEPVEDGLHMLRWVPIPVLGKHAVA